MSDPDRDHGERGREAMDRQRHDQDRERRSGSDDRLAGEGGGDYGGRGYGEASGSEYGEGGYPDTPGRGGYGPEGYGAHHGAEGDHDARSFGGPTYSDREQHLAQRSRWREDQRYGDHRSTGETYEPGGERREAEYGGVDRTAQDGAQRDNPDRRP